MKVYVMKAEAAFPLLMSESRWVYAVKKALGSNNCKKKPTPGYFSVAETKSDRYIVYVTKQEPSAYMEVFLYLMHFFESMSMLKSVKTRMMKANKDIKKLSEEDIKIEDASILDSMVVL